MTKTRTSHCWTSLVSQLVWTDIVPFNWEDTASLSLLKLCHLTSADTWIWYYLDSFCFFSYWGCCICYFASKHSLEHSYFYSITYVYIFSSCLRSLSFPSGLFLSFYTNVLSITSDKVSLLKSFKNLKWILFQGQVRK